MPIRLVLAEDHYLVREGLRRLLADQADLEIAAVCGDLEALLAAVDAEEPDVVVTDIRMPPGDTDEGIQAASAFASRIRRSASSCSASTRTPATRSRSSRAAARGARTS